MKKIISIIIWTLIGMLILIGITYWSLSKKTSKSIKMGYAPFASNWPFFVAIEKGYFHEEGLDIEPEKFVDSKSMMDALITKRVDHIAPIALPVIFGVEQSQPELLKIFLVAAERKTEERNVISGIVVKKDSLIKSISHLKGRKIGTYPGTAALVSVKLILIANGVDPEKEVSIIQVAPELQIHSLLANQFDALFTIEPYTTIAITKNVGQLIETNPRAKYITDPYIVGAQVFLKESIEKNPEVSKKIINALKKGISFIKENPAAARKILAKWSIYEEEVAKESGLYEWFDVSSKTPETTKIRGEIQKMANIFYKNGILNKSIDTSRMYPVEGLK